MLCIELTVVAVKFILRKPKEIFQLDLTITILMVSQLTVITKHFLGNPNYYVDFTKATILPCKLIIKEILLMQEMVSNLHAHKVFYTVRIFCRLATEHKLIYGGRTENALICRGGTKYQLVC